MHNAHRYVILFHFRDPKGPYYFQFSFSCPIEAKSSPLPLNSIIPLLNFTSPKSLRLTPKRIRLPGAFHTSSSRLRIMKSKVPKRHGWVGLNSKSAYEHWPASVEAAHTAVSSSDTVFQWSLLDGRLSQSIIVLDFRNGNDSSKWRSAASEISEARHSTLPDAINSWICSASVYFINGPDTFNVTQSIGLIKRRLTDCMMSKRISGDIPWDETQTIDLLGHLF